MQKSTSTIAIILAIGISIAGASSILYFAFPSPTSSIEMVEATDYIRGLQPKPDDFYVVTRETQSQYIDLCKLGSSYYLQPEFYIQSWDRGKHYYENHDYSRWGVHGHGAYPGNPQVYFNETEPNTWISFCTFYRTGWNIETWQGVKLISEPSEYFDVSIEPSEFLLSPTFPSFKEGWVTKLVIKVTVKKTPPQGTYKIPINAVNPSQEKAKEWFWEVLKREADTEEECVMVELCKQQDISSSQCKEWVEGSRKNKYIDAGFIQIGNRLVLEIYV